MWYQNHEKRYQNGTSLTPGNRAQMGRKSYIIPKFSDAVRHCEPWKKPRKGFDADSQRAVKIANQKQQSPALAGL
jgi:hypothetical protein